MNEKTFIPYKVLIIGDCMLDQYIHGEVHRISPEAPIPVLSKTRSYSKPGGAANVAANIKSLGATPTLIGLVGVDENATKLKNILDEWDIHHVLQDDTSRPTTIKTRIIAKGQQIVRVDEESTTDISDDVAQALTDKIETQIRSGTNCIILQDYNKGLLTSALIKKIIAIGNRENIPTLVDPKFKNLDAYHGCEIVKPNLKELEQAIGYTIETRDASSFHEATEAFRKLINFKKCYVTLGKEGIYNHQNGEIYTLKTKEIVDVTGAGDSVISILALAQLAFENEAKITNLMNKAGLASCMHEGSYAVSVGDIL